jgi:transposase InsO family protein
MDWQQLPAIEGNTGFAYKISIIHLSTRIKYSEIHHDHKTKTLAAFLERAIKRLPPFYVVFTDNHMAFTMKFAYRSERKTTFTKKAESMEIIHALIAKGKPWRNGFIERSNRTDNEALFNHKRFSCEEHRRYELRLWEMYYNRQRPHQGIHMNTPLQRARQQHFCRVSNLALC